MTAVLWVALGMSAGAAVLHAALGLTRPVDRTYLSFACIMAFLAVYLYFEWELYRSVTVAEAVESMRCQLVAAHGFLACVLIFVPAYTRMPLRRRIAVVYWVGLACLFLANLVLPYGIWFSGPPKLVPMTFGGEPYTGVIVPPLGPLQHLHTAYVISLFALALRDALALIRRGARRQGVMLAISVFVVVVFHILDLLRDVTGGLWPYVAEFGAVAWGLIMSVQLAIDFRISEQRLQDTLRKAEQHAAELTRTVEATLQVRDKLNTPLQTLELGLALREPRKTDDATTLIDLRRAVEELTKLGRAVEQTTQQHWRRGGEEQRS